MQKFRFWFSKRFLVVILAFFGEMNIFSLKANLNIAILDMTSSRKETHGNATITHEAEFNWDSPTKGFILGVDSYGSLISPLGGYLAMRYGGSTIITISSLIASIITLLSPVIVRFNFYLFVVARIADGITECFRFVSFPELWTHWSPIRDRSKLMAITLGGLYAGPAIGYPIFGLITQHFGWPATFYFTGGFSLLWTTLWFLLVPNSPTTDKWISKEELAYIQQDPPQLKPKNEKSMLKNMLLSKHVYATGITKLIYHFGFAVAVTCLPMYMKDLTNTRIDKIGFYSAIPNIINIFTIPCVGFILDHLQNKNYMTTTGMHKLFVCGAFILGGVILLVIPYLPNILILFMIFLSVFKLTISVNYVVCHMNIIALAPKCCSVLASFISWFHMLGSVSAPLIIAFIVTDHSLSQWNFCFTIFAVLSFMGSAIFFIFGSSEPQPWAYSIEEQLNKSDTHTKAEPEHENETNTRVC